MSIDIPTAVTPAEAGELVRLARDNTVLELGSLLGYSTVRMAQVARRVHSVDRHEGYPANNPRPTFDTFLHHLNWYGVRDRVTIHVAGWEEVLPVLAPRQFSLVFIDLTGLYEDTLRAMWASRRLLHHYGALAVHDCGHPDWPGAMKAAEDFAERLGTTFRLVDRMAIFEQTW